MIFVTMLLAGRYLFFLGLQKERLQVLALGGLDRMETAVGILEECLHSPVIIKWQGSANPVGSEDPAGANDDPLDSDQVDLVVLAGPPLEPSALRLAAEFRFNGVPVWDLPRLYAELAERLPAQHLGEFWLATAEGFHFFTRHHLRPIKHVLDVTVASLGLLLSSPLSLLAIILIKLEDGGQVFYSQERVGYRGKSFTIYKFRTMVPTAEKETGPVWSTGNDPRVTRVGRFLRTLRIDEIPQMWNVLRGEMSFIGPRPERPVFVDNFQQKYPIYRLRHLVRPGITGWAQVKFPYGASEVDTLRKLEYDLYYIQNFSILFDVRILLRTISVMLSGSGAR